MQLGQSSVSTGADKVGGANVIKQTKEPNRQALPERPTLKMLVQIFLTFLKIGPVTFGGGYAMIPLIEKEIVTKRKWIKVEEITDILAVSESIPGAIAINASTFIGYRLAGVRGAIAAMLGVLLPTFLIVVLLSIFFLKVQDNPKIEAAFIAIRATIVALITYAAITIGRTAVLDKTTVVLIVITVILMFFLKVHPVLLIVGGGVAGIAIIAVKKRLGMSFKLERTAKNKDKSKQVQYSSDDYYMGDGI